MELDEEDVGGLGEEDFEEGMRQNAEEYDAADKDADNKLDFGEFCAMVRQREVGDFTEEELKARFAALDADGSGKVDMGEYLQFSLRDALARSSDRVIDLFKKWDEDKSGVIDKKEFCQAMNALGFSIPPAECGKVFDQLDEDKSGKLEYKELNAVLRKGTGSDAAKRHLQRGKDAQGKSGKGTARANNSNYQSARVAALPPMVKLSIKSGKNVAEQLKEILDQNSVKLIDLFREWDTDGNGAIDAKEFRKAVSALGYDVPKKEMNKVFADLDASGDGFIEYGEFKKVLRDPSKVHVAVIPDEPVEKPKKVAPPPPEPEPEPPADWAAVRIQARARGMATRGRVIPLIIQERAKRLFKKPVHRTMPPTIVGSRVRVWWSVDQRWYEAKVLQYQKALGWQVRYDEEGVKWASATRWHNFAFEKWEIIDEDES